MSNEKCNATCSDGSTCEAWAMDGSNRCRHHGGKSTGPKTKEGKKKSAGNSEKHGLTADPKKYHERQEQPEKEWIHDLSATIEDRIRRVRGDVDPLDRVLARRIAIKLHIAAKASEYVDETGIIQTVVTDDGEVKEIPNGIVQELRQYDREILNELKKLGLVDDPESKKAGAMGELKDLWKADLQG